MTKTKKAFLIFLVLAAIAFTIYEYISENQGGITRNSNITINYDTGSKADFYTYDKNIFYLTKDGLQMINQKGETIWTDTFNMSAPSMITDGGAVAVMEKDGRILNVYDEKGAVCSINTDNNIASASLNSNGYVCIISKGDTYYLGVYNRNGEKIFDGNFAADDGFPVCSDISDDGKILSVSFLDIKDINVKSRVCFYYIGENIGTTEEDSDSDYMFASFIEDDSVVGELHFMEGNALSAVSDKSISIISLNPTENEKYKQNMKYELNNKVIAANFTNKKVISIAFGEPNLNSQNALKKNTVKMFNYKGSELGSYEAEKDINSLKSSNNAFLVSMGKEFAAIDSKGSVLWEYKAIQDIRDMAFLSSTYDVLVVGIKEAYSVNINGMENSEDFNIKSDENDENNSNDSNNTDSQNNDNNDITTNTANEGNTENNDNNESVNQPEAESN